MMRMTKTMAHTRSNQEGMVAIVATMILMIVISLIVLGFSQVVRRNQRQAIDAQLSSQAFYAAESGLNLAASKIGIDPDYENKNNCDIPAGEAGEYEINTNTKITCLLTSSVEDLRYDGIGSTSRVTLIDLEGSDTPGTIFINWENSDGAAVNDCSGGTTLPRAGAANWQCTQPLLRVDLIPISDSMRRSDLVASQYTAFLYPSNSPSGVTNFNADNKGDIVQAQCDNGTTTNKTLKCLVRINGANEQKYAVRMMSLYGTSNVRLHVRDFRTLIGAQAEVDSTARAFDVLKRVQSRVSLFGTLDGSRSVPDFAIDSGDGICKAYKVSAGDVSVETGSNYAACSVN